MRCVRDSLMVVIYLLGSDGTRHDLPLLATLLLEEPVLEALIESRWERVVVVGTDVVRVTRAGHALRADIARDRGHSTSLRDTRLLRSLKPEILTGCVDEIVICGISPTRYSIRMSFKHEYMCCLQQTYTCF